MQTHPAVTLDGYDPPLRLSLPVMVATCHYVDGELSRSLSVSPPLDASFVRIIRCAYRDTLDENVTRFQKSIVTVF